MRYREIGKTGINASVIGFGTMRFPTDETGKLNEKKAIEMVRFAIDNGLNYIDTAYPYHDGLSESMLGKALGDGYREKVVLTTKSPLWELKCPEDFDRILDEQLKKLKTDYVDFYLLHSVTRTMWKDIVLKFNLLDRLRKAKKDGKVLHIGFSFHDDYDCFLEVLNTFYDCEACLLQMNYVDINNQATMKGISFAREKGIGVIIMEPVRGGLLANPPSGIKNILTKDKPYARHALDFLWDKEEVNVVLSGMSTMEQISQNILWASESSAGMLSEQEKEMYKKAEEVWRTSANVPCTKCEYCLPCPLEIDIPRVYEAYNGSVLEKKKNIISKYGQALSKVADCIGCGQCTGMCPQKIDGAKTMAEIQKYFEKAK